MKKISNLILALLAFIPGHIFADTLIPATGEVQAFLASGYDSKTQTRTGTCIEGDVEYTGINTSEENFIHNASYSQMTNILSGGVSGNVKYGYFNFNGQFDYAKNTAATALDMSYTDVISITPKRITLTNYRIAKNMQSLIVNPDDTVKDSVDEYCGDEFVTQADIGAKLLINIKFSFKNSSDLTAFSGKIGVNLYSIADLEGQLTAENKNFLSNAIVSIQAKQIGGDTSKLALSIPENAVYCGLSDKKQMVDGKEISPIQTCLDILNSFSKYKTDFAAQLKDKKYDPNDAKGWAYFNWIATSYKNALVASNNKPVQIVPSIPSPALEQAIVDARQQLKTAYDTNLQDERQVSELMLFNIPLVQKQKLMAISKIIDSNLDTITEGVKMCFGDDISYCVQETTDALSNLKTYDKNAFLIFNTATTNFLATGLWIHLGEKSNSFINLSQNGTLVSTVANDSANKNLALYGTGSFITNNTLFMNTAGEENKFSDNSQTKCLLNKDIAVTFIDNEHISVQFKPEPQIHNYDTNCNFPVEDVCIFNLNDTPPVMTPSVTDAPICPAVLYSKI